MHAYCNYTWQGGQPWPACTIVEYAIRGRSITLRSAHRNALKRRRHRHTLKTAHTDEASNSFLTSCEQAWNVKLKRYISNQGIAAEAQQFLRLFCGSQYEDLHTVGKFVYNPSKVIAVGRLLLRKTRFPVPG